MYVGNIYAEITCKSEKEFQKKLKKINRYTKEMCELERGDFFGLLLELCDDKIIKRIKKFKQENPIRYYDETKHGLFKRPSKYYDARKDDCIA